MIGTILPTDEEMAPHAIVQRTTTGSTYTIRIGETLNKDTTVIDIKPKRVTLEKAGMQHTLTLNTILWIK